MHLCQGASGRVGPSATSAVRFRPRWVDCARSASGSPKPVRCPRALASRLPTPRTVRYGSHMRQREHVPPEREQLVKQLAELPESERRAVIAAAERAARVSGGAVISWQSLRAAAGIIKGTPADAVEDCMRLYDG